MWWTGPHIRALSQYHWANQRWVEWAAARTYYVRRLFPRGQDPAEEPPVLPPGWVHVVDEDPLVDGSEGSGAEQGEGPMDSPQYGPALSVGSCTGRRSREERSEEVDGPDRKRQRIAGVPLLGGYVDWESRWDAWWDSWDSLS